MCVDGHTFDLHEASFVDDGAQPVCDTAPLIVQKTTSIASVWHRVLAVSSWSLIFLKANPKPLLCLLATVRSALSLT